MRLKRQVSNTEQTTRQDRYKFKHSDLCPLFQIVRKIGLVQRKSPRLTPNQDIDVLFSGYEKFESPARKNNQDLHEPNCSL